MSMRDRGHELPIDVAHLRKRFGEKIALADFHLQLQHGQIFGAVGANGGGKTTALRVLAGLLPADAGSGHVLGVDLRAHPSRLRARVGYMTQHYSLYSDLTVAENLLARARIYSVTDPRNRVAALLAQFDLGKFARERVVGLSGGWRRRVQFVATLVPQPRLLLLDEPTAGLDLETSRHLWDAIAELAAEGTTIVISTHDLVEAARCELIGVFVEGEVIAMGTVDEVIEGSAARVLRVATARVDLASMRAALPELAFVRRGTRHHDLVFRGEIPPPSLAWLRSRNLPLQTIEPTLEDAMSIYVKPQPR